MHFIYVPSTGKKKKLESMMPHSLQTLKFIFVFGTLHCVQTYAVPFAQSVSWSVSFKKNKLSEHSASHWDLLAPVLVNRELKWKWPGIDTDTFEDAIFISTARLPSSFILNVPIQIFGSLSLKTIKTLKYNLLNCQAQIYNILL